MKLLYGVIPTLVILSVIVSVIISNPVEAETLESRYLFTLYLVFDSDDLNDAIQVKDAFKTKSETYPLKEHFEDWEQWRGDQGDRELIALRASFTFDSKADCIAFYNWIITNMPQDIRDNIIYGRILVTDNTHHFPPDEIKGDVIIFENTIGNRALAQFDN